MTGRVSVLKDIHLKGIVWPFFPALLYQHSQQTNTFPFIPLVSTMGVRQQGLALGGKHGPHTALQHSAWALPALQAGRPFKSHVQSKQLPNPMAAP